MNPVTYVVPGKPCGINATHAGGGPRPFRKTSEAKTFAALLAVHGRHARFNAGWATTERPVEVTIRVVLDSDRPDTDGPVKAVLDSLEVSRPRINRPGAGFIANDRQVKRYHVERHIDRQNPRVEITIAEVA